MKRYALDASAMMIHLENRSGAEKMEKLLTAAEQRDAEIYISAVNVGEVFYSVWHRRGESDARRALTFVKGAPIIIVPATLDETILAAEFKAHYQFPLADSFAASLAISRRATLITSDSDFRRFSDRLKILWLSGHKAMN